MAVTITENKELIEFRDSSSRVKDIARHKNHITNIKLQSDGTVSIFSDIHPSLTYSLNDITSPSLSTPEDLRDHLWNLWGASNCNYNYSAAFYLDIGFDSGDSFTEVSINSNRESIIYEVDSKSNTGDLSYEIDDGTGYVTVNLPFRLSDGDTLKVTRTDTANDGYVILKGSY